MAARKGRNQPRHTGLGIAARTAEPLRSANIEELFPFDSALARIHGGPPMAEDPLINPPFIARYRKCFETTWDDETPIDDVRFVVLDCETTGLNPRADRIITIGAVAVQNGEILLEDSFDALIKFSRNTGAVTVHGVTRDQ